MGKVRVKLSKSMQREMAVRRQLGISARSSKAKGRLGAIRASEELARRQRAERKRRTGWDDLCFELQDMILQRLSIGDLMNARMAGLGCSSVAARERMKAHMLKRCKAVKPLWKIWSRGTPKYQTEAERVVCKPVEFTSNVSKLCLAPGVDGIPESICEMRALKYLDISRTHHHTFMGLPPPLTTLPPSLAQCQGLYELRMSHHNFESIPKCVLKLRHLRRFDIEYNVHLKDLPEDIGTCLSQLAYINLTGCRKIKRLPPSLLQRLEQAITSRARHRIPLQLSARYFDGDYLASTITRDTYPKLADYLRSGALTGPEMPWGMFDHLIEEE